jgi:NACHT domain
VDSMSEIGNTLPETEPHLKRERTRDDFPKRVVDALARRVGFLCSNPNCPAPHTSGPHSDDSKFVNLGVASHITAAAPRGPRFDAALSPDERRSINNGIWLCQGCSVLIDRDGRSYPADLLREWKRQAESAAESALRGAAVHPKRPIEQADRNRRSMIEKVRTIWITGYLQKSLSHEVRILLGLSERPDAVARPFDLLVMRPDEGERPMPVGTRVVDVYDSMDEALLILGAPGSGKTTELLELASDLLNRTDRDPDHPIPVVFPLSTWAESRKPLDEWLKDELKLRYDVPPKIAQEWIGSDQVMALLDGLDEVKAEHRAACVFAINVFRQSHGFLPLVISSRTDEYEVLAAPLRLHGAIRVHPLTREQVNFYLSDLGPAGMPVRAAIRDDPSLWNLLDSPLLLNIITAAYAGPVVAPPPMNGAGECGRDHLFGLYVNEMLRRRSAERCYKSEQTHHWLCWLAYQMRNDGGTVFYLERLPSSYLPRRLRWLVHLSYGLCYGLIFALAVALFTATFARSVSDLSVNVVSPFALSVGLFSGLLVGLFSALRSTREEAISCVDDVHYSWASFWRPKPRILFTVYVYTILSSTLISALFSGFTSGIYAPTTRALDYGVPAGLVFGCTASVVNQLFAGLTLKEIEKRTVPNQGIRRSGRNGLFVAMAFVMAFGMLCALLAGVFGGISGDYFGGRIYGIGHGLKLGLKLGLMYGIAMAPVVALGAGGAALLKHLILRLLLKVNNSIPWDYVRFLDYAADRILLRKVGGGYMFIHRMLLEHFAARYVEPGTMPKKAASSGEEQP